ncbi:hypothetical protein EVG20_g651 [Dentipellis fragilis]|uniref:Uncharacterized protein n=1 Tax=Dentipellis fragilis TaxID=205917 RepID=A0A4Y9ZC20_9AGAM|nr:hypothetical protein EVG20_g651 [Dentipellis fragilis]
MELLGSLAPSREHDLSAARQQTDGEIEDHRNTLSQLLLRRNEQSLINIMLPPEILGMIFVHTATDGNFSVSRPSRWLQVTHVCVRWRDIARILTPRLWTTIWAADTHPSLVQDMLVRSGNTPLTLVVASGLGIWSPDRFHANMAMLMGQRERVRDVSVMGTSILPTIAHLNSYYDTGLTLNRVESLRLHFPDIQPNPSHQLGPFVILGMSPSLIRVENYSIAPYPPLFQNLKEFHALKGLRWSLTQLLDALLCMPLLEILSLTYPFRSPETTPDVYSDAANRTVVLSRLHHLRLIGSDMDSRIFFSHVVLPTCPSLAIDVPTIDGIAPLQFNGPALGTLILTFCARGPTASGFALELIAPSSSPSPRQAALFGPAYQPPGKSSLVLKLAEHQSYSLAIRQVTTLCRHERIVPQRRDTEHPAPHRRADGVPGHQAAVSQILDLVRVDEQEAVKVPFPHLNALVIVAPRLQQTTAKGSGTRNYFIKDLADCFYDRTYQYGAAALEHLIIDGERIAPAVLGFYASLTCGTINMDSELNPPNNIDHDMDSLQTFLSLANLDL